MARFEPIGDFDATDDAIALATFAKASTMHGHCTRMAGCLDLASLDADLHAVISEWAKQNLSAKAICGIGLTRPRIRPRRTTTIVTAGLRWAAGSRSATTAVIASQGFSARNAE
jgi:hypothetical protein